jgi:hypothetical protein
MTKNQKQSVHPVQSGAKYLRRWHGFRPFSSSGIFLAQFFVFNHTFTYLNTFSDYRKYKIIKIPQKKFALDTKNADQEWY